MSIESYINALPKTELELRLEGAVPRETMLMFADQNEIGAEVKRFKKWIDLYQTPDFKRLDDLTEMLRSWLRYGDDLTRAVYDVGVQMSKSNVRYAEVAVNPLSYVKNDFTFDEFLNALDDGRDRAHRGWGVQMRWTIIIPREIPRRSDEIARWATSATAKKAGVVGITLAGYHANESLDQFERAFRTAQKKDIMRSAYLTAKDDIDEAIDALGLQRVIDGWGIAESPETLESMAEQGISFCVGIKRNQSYGWVRQVNTIPMTTILESGVKVAVSSDMPVIFGSTLADEYISAIENNLLNIEQVEEIARDTITMCGLDEDEKAELTTMFDVEMEVLRMEHLNDETEPSE